MMKPNCSSRLDASSRPLLDRHRMWLEAAQYEPNRKTAPWVVNVNIAFHTRGRIVANLIDVGLDALALLDAVKNGNLGREQIADLLRGGHA